MTYVIAPNPPFMIKKDKTEILNLFFMSQSSLQARLNRACIYYMTFVKSYSIIKENTKKDDDKMNILKLEEVYKFHPFYAEFKEQGFDAYLCQTFLRFEDDAKIELRLSGGINATPETMRNGYFIDRNTAIINGKEIKVKDNVTVNLSYIGIDKDECKKRGRGSALLDWFVNLCDKYNYRIELDMDTKFRTPIEALERFYGKRDFIRTSDSHMIRPSKTERNNKYSTSELKNKLYLVKEYTYLLNKIKDTILDFDDEDSMEHESILYKEKIENYLSTLERDFKIGLSIIEDRDDIDYVNLCRLKESVLTIIEFAEMEYDSEGLSDKINNLKNFIKKLEELI